MATMDHLPLTLLVLLLFALRIVFSEIFQSSNNSGSTPFPYPCPKDCSTVMDCDVGMSCFGAKLFTKGCCLQTLKPNQTGCILNEQCKRICDTSFCDRSQQPHRCVCIPGKHLMFGKCWDICPEFAEREPYFYANGLSKCVLKRYDLYIQYQKRRRRLRRHMRRNFC